MAEFVPVSKGRQRLIFGSGHDVIPLPDMVEVQRESYRSFFQEGAAPEDRESVGLQELLDEISPISNFDGSFRLEFLGYEIDEPSMSQEEAKRRDCTWHRPIRAKVRLHNDRAQEVREEEIYLGDFPVMTPRGTFIINGTGASSSISWPAAPAFISSPNPAPRARRIIRRRSSPSAVPGWSSSWPAIRCR